MVLACKRGLMLAACVTGALLSASRAIGDTADPYERPGADLSRFFTLEHTAVHGPFRVEQWVSRAWPEISPAGIGHYVYVVRDGEREVLRRHVEAIALNVLPVTGQDLTGDGQPEIVFAGWTGGANCCNWMEIYSVAPGSGVSSTTASVSTALLDMPAGSCPGELQDLDGDGRYEVVSCDSLFARAFCAFAYSPFPPVVYGLDDDGRYVIDTAKYAHYLPKPGAWQDGEDGEDAEDGEADKIAPPVPTRDPAAKCEILSPALDLVYTGHQEEGFALLRENYLAPDAAEFIKQVRTMLEGSDLWLR